MKLVFVRKLPLRRLQIADDDRQEVVEVVSYSPRKLSNRFHFLRLTKRQFDILPPNRLCIEIIGPT